MDKPKLEKMDKGAMWLALNNGEILDFGEGYTGYFDLEDNYGPYVAKNNAGKKESMNGLWNRPCRIIPKPETRYMTQAEAVAFVVNTPGCVARCKGNAQWNFPQDYEYVNPAGYEWTTCTIDGTYGEPKEFKKEV